MQVCQMIVDDREAPRHPAPLLPRRPGTIGVTLRLDPPRYDRLKRLVRRLSTTSQSVLQSALDNRMVALERQPQAPKDVEGQISLFAPLTTARKSWKPAVQDSFGFARPEPKIAPTYRAPVPMHRWLHQRSMVWIGSEC
jgi:hypothetical protein